MEVHQIYKTIKEHHLDVFGHVNNAVYLRFFEEARWDFITKNGYGLDVVKQEGIGPTILEVTIRYRKEIKNRDKVVIETRCKEIRGRIMSIEQIIVNEEGQKACVAQFKIALFDVNKRKLVDITPKWLKAMGMETQQ